MASGSRFLGCGARREGEHAVAHDGHAVTLTWMAGLAGGEGSIFPWSSDVAVEDMLEEVDMLRCDWLYARNIGFIYAYLHDALCEEGGRTGNLQLCFPSHFDSRPEGCLAVSRMTPPM